MKLFAFAREGTVETGKGPISLEIIRKLSKNHLIFALDPKLSEEAQISLISGMPKTEALESLRKTFRCCEEYIAVDRDPLFVKGWRCFDPYIFLDTDWLD